MIDPLPEPPRDAVRDVLAMIALLWLASVVGAAWRWIEIAMTAGNAAP